MLAGTTAPRVARQFGRQVATTLLLAILLVLATVPPGRPAETAAQILERLQAYVRLAVSVDQCGFAMSTNEATHLGNAIDGAVLALRLPYTGYDSIMLDVKRRMEAEGWTRLCRQGGAWHADYRRQLAAVGA